MAGLDSDVPSAVTSAVLVVVAGTVAEIVPVMVGRGVNEAVAVSDGTNNVGVYVGVGVRTAGKKENPGSAGGAGRDVGWAREGWTSRMALSIWIRP